MAEGITHVERVPADAGLAAEQHRGYVSALAAAGWTVREVASAEDLPDSVFVEDAVVVLDNFAV